MKKTLLLILLTAIIPALGYARSKSYDIVEIYEKVDLERGAKSVDSYGDIKDAKAILVPTKIDKGKYQVKLTRKDTNFYHIDGTSLYVETKYCYEYATKEEVFMNITSSYGYTCGEVIFTD